jgi:excinuclease UvrABC nuclease subunit
MLIRGGRNLGTTCFFPRALLAEPQEALVSFIMQYYASAEVPAEVLLGSPFEDARALAEALSERVGHASFGVHPVRGHRGRWLELTAGERHAGTAHALRSASGHGRDAARSRP